MVFHHLLYPQQSGVDIQQMVGVFREDLNVPVFLQAWQRVVQRHPIFRTSFRWHGLTEPLQDVHRQVTLPFDQQDWCGVSTQERQELLATYLRADRQRGFDITVAPLMRLALFRTGQADYDFVWTFHHLLLDGRSFFLTLQELFAFYEALCHSQDLQLPQPPPPRAYIDWLQQQDLSQAEGFWRQMLAGFTAPTPLIADPLVERDLPLQDSRGEQQISLSADITSVLQSLAKQQQVTLYTVIQGAWALLLSRYSGEEDVVFGTTHLCRRGTVEQAESMVGMFMNTLPVRVHVSPEMPVWAWLKKLRAEQVAVRGYEHTPLLKVQEWSEIRRGTPLFDSILVFENFRWTSSLREQGSGWENRQLRILEQPNYALTVFGSVDTDLLLSITYDRSRFADATVARMLEHFRTLLASIAANPDQRVVDVQLLTPAEHNQLVVEWNQTQAAYPRDTCLHGLFETQAERTPDVVAVTCGDEQLTYRELDERTDQLAHSLRARGVKAERLVGICVERSVALLVGVLGILKAGGAYVPLDPTYPKERLAFMLEDAQVPVLVTQRRLLDGLPAHRAQVVCVDSDWEGRADQSQAPCASAVTAENLAYVIYTSGSTGMPKGVQISHRAVVNCLHALRQQLGVTAQDTLLAVTTLSFDIAVLELFLPLMVGARVALATRAEAADGEQLKEKLARTGATLMQATPTTWRLLLAAGWEGQPRLQMLCGGEALTRDLADALLVRGAALWNLYGPTEATIWSAAGRVEAASGPVKLGCPLANTQFYVLDPQLRPVPVGVPGELYIGGEGLARGYLHRPELAAEKFLPHPFTDKPRERLYKTGDRVRHWPDGSLEYLGRLDHQVKLRGFRIELGEIEAVLTQHPAVQQAVVLVREDTSGDPRLVTYIIPRPGLFLQIENLRDFLKGKLPSYMVPVAFVPLETLSVTPNGKVDRRALPAPAQTKTAHKVMAPRDEVERQLVQIWEDLFQVRPIGVQDDFFELGGHSLLAVRMLSKAQQVVGKRLPLASLFQGATIAQLAHLLRQQDSPDLHPCIVGIQPYGTKPPFFCVHGVRGGVFTYKELVRLLGPDQPLYGIQAPGLDKEEESGEPRQSLESLAAQYVTAMRALQPQGPYFMGGWSMGGALAFEMARQLRAHGQQVALLALIDTWAPGPRLTLARRFWNFTCHFLPARVKKPKAFLQEIQNAIRSRLRELWYLGIWNSQARHLHRLMKANIHAAQCYIPQQYPGKLTLFRALHQRITVESDLQLGWSKFVTGEIEIHDIPGDHATIFDSPHVQVLAACLQACLQKAQEECSRKTLLCHSLGEQNEQKVKEAA